MAGKARAAKPGAAGHAAPGGEPPEVLRGYYRQMALVRAFELRAAQMYTQARIGGYCHLNLGEEATVVGLMAALESRDYLFTTYREHGYALARGLDPGRVMAELFGKATGVSGGWGGSMHLFDSDARLLGGYGIVGGQIPPVTGAALALAYRGEPGPGAEAVMCLMGDGTTNIGAFHESLNLAALWRLPIVHVIINNRLGMARRSSGAPRNRTCGSGAALTGFPVSGWTATTCWPSATPPARRCGAPAPSGSPACWRRSATGCAGTRWSTRRRTGPGRRPGGFAPSTRCQHSGPGCWRPESSTRRRRCGSRRKPTSTSRMPTTALIPHPISCSPTPTPARSPTPRASCQATRSSRGNRKAGGGAHGRDQLPAGTARHPTGGAGP